MVQPVNVDIDGVAFEASGATLSASLMVQPPGEIDIMPQFTADGAVLGARVEV